MKYLLFWKPAVWLAVIVFLSLMPGDRIPGVTFFPHADKLAHAIFYSVMTILLIKPLNVLLPKGSYLMAVAICLVAGMVVEVMQEYLATNRSGNWKDALANLTGALMGVVLWHVLVRNSRWKRYV